MKRIKPIEITRNKILTGCCQHIGKRQEQQDSFGFSDIYNENISKEVGVMAVLTDGMGGLVMGKESSQLGADIALEVYTNKALSEDIPEALLRSVYVANEQIYQMAKNNNVIGNTGTTLVATVILDKKLYWISVGDSIIYFFSNGRLRKLNQDHNYGNQLDKKVLDGEMSWEEAQQHTERHHLTSYLGLDEVKEIDRNEDSIKLNDGDLVLLCSDGLTNTLSRPEIRDIILNNNKDMQKLADDLVNITIERNEQYQDNVTVAILKLSEKNYKNIKPKVIRRNNEVKR